MLARGLNSIWSMKRTVTLAFAAVGLLGMTGAATAQPGAYAEPPPNGPAPVATAAPRVQKWGIGIRTTNLEIVSSDDENNAVELSGVGLHLRYRLAPNWRAELTVEGAKSDDETLGFTRDSTIGTLGLHYIFNPYARWNVYGLAGLGVTETEIEYDANSRGGQIEEFSETHLHLGIGLERRFETISLGAELRGVFLARNDEEGDALQYAGVDGPVPVESSAGQLNLHFTYYF